VTARKKPRKQKRANRRFAMTDRYGGSQIAGEGQCWVVFCPSAMGPRAKAPGGGALAARGATRPQAAAGNKKILRRERPVYPKTGQSHPKNNCATYGRSSLFAVITTTKYNNFAY
jgi:hypothetical protein